MLSTRFYPFREMLSEMNRLQNEMGNVFGRWPSSSERSFARGYPALNAWERGETLFVEAELPGLTSDDLEIHVQEGNQLAIKGERKRPEVENGTWHRRERGYGSFTRVIELPFPVDADKVRAHFKDGVLLIELPKLEEAKPRRIEVHAE